MSVRAACEAFGVSETCYRYRAKRCAENEVIAEWLVKLTHNQRNWGFGLCFLYLRNVNGFAWNHKRVYRIYRELELNLRIKPRKRLVREQPEPLAVPLALNECWSMGTSCMISSPTVVASGCLTSSTTLTARGCASKWTSRCRRYALSGHWIRLSNGAASR